MTRTFYDSYSPLTRSHSISLYVIEFTNDNIHYIVRLKGWQKVGINGQGSRLLAAVEDPIVKINVMIKIIYTSSSKFCWEDFVDFIPV